MNIKNTKTYKLFKQELEEILNTGFSIEQACYILIREHNAINQINGYRYKDVAYSAFLSLEYLIKQVQDEAIEQELNEQSLDVITYRFTPEKARTPEFIRCITSMDNEELLRHYNKIGGIEA